jgi:steroid 5-alpha reductase family enzyme
VWTLFDLGFVALFQNLVLAAITMPAYVLMLTTRLPGASADNDLIDTIFSRALVVVLLIESLADQQQWAFQQAKKSYKATGEVPEGYSKEDLDRGFVVSGLWSFCRHPNFSCEQTFWFGVYEWACFRTDTMVNWTGIGAVAYWGIFQGSTNFTEGISAGKYPEYKEYQALVNKFVPGFKTLIGQSEKPVKRE